MKLQLPDFDKSRFRLLLLSNSLRADDVSLPEEAQFYWRYGESAYLRFECDRSGFRVLLSSENIFDVELDSTKSNSDIESMFDRLSGHEVEVDMQAGYDLPLSDLPAWINSSIINTKSGTVGIKTSGGEFEFTGTPVNSMRWWMGKNKVHVVLMTRTQIEVGPDYVKRCLDLVEPVFQTLVTRQ